METPAAAAMEVLPAERAGAASSPRNFIRAVHVGAYGRAKKKILDLAYPRSEGDPYSVNALCGRNNSGKTHILREIGQAFDDRSFHNTAEKESLNVHAVLLDPEAPPPKVLYLPDLTSDKNRLNEIPITFKHDPQGRTPKYREAIVGFVADQLACLLGPEFEKERWIREAEYRGQIVEQLEEAVVYRCKADTPVIRRFEEAVRGRLYFGRKGPGKRVHLEFAIRYDDHRVFYFPSWSDGQKTLLTAFLLIHHHSPDVLLLDEIENHFHPEFITQLTHFLKDVVPQTLLVTHHPHVLFSSLVDRLFYLEVQASQDEEMPDAVRLPQGFRSRSPQRQISELITEFDRITAAYGLFDYQDRQLLTLAQATHQSIDTSFTKSLVNLFRQPAGRANSPVGPTEEMLADFLRTVRRGEGPFQILDYGAVRGKALLDLLRTARLELGPDIQWTCWGADSPQPFTEVAWAPFGVRFLSRENPPAEGAYDLAILSNVLHEMTPKAFAETFTTVRRAIRAEGGCVAIVEPYPLIRPEKYAVPYSLDDMESVLAQCGWKVEGRNLPVPGGLIGAYCICAYDPDAQRSFDVSLAENVVKERWGEILKRSCTRYDGRRHIESARDQIEVMGLLTTIASISNYNLGNWR